jgi:hypothetical protein
MSNPMARGIARLVIVLVAWLGLFGHAAAANIAVRIEVMSDADIFIAVGDVYPQPLRFRVVRADTGIPVAGATVYVFVNLSFCIPLAPAACESDAAGYYGSFDTPEGDIEAVLTSDASGIVTTPLFRAGETPSTHEIVAATLGSDPLYASASTHRGRVIVHQVARPLPGLKTIPALGVGGLSLLSVCILASLRLRGKTASR